MTAVHPYVTGATPVTACPTTAVEAAGNAMYCPADDSLSYDLNYLRGLFAQLGAAGPVTILAHEWGHHVATFTGRPVLTTRSELQADCYAGMYIRSRVDAGTLPIGFLKSSSRLFEAMGDDRLDLGGTSDWYDEDVHGTGTERRQAEGIGYSSGNLEACLAYGGWAPAPPLPLGQDVSLTLPPGSIATSRSTGTSVVTMPGARISIDVLPGMDDLSPADALDAWLRLRFGEDISLTRLTAGFLELDGWARGSGDRVTFDRAAANATPVGGIAGLQLDPSGTARIFVAEADDGTAVGRYRPRRRSRRRRDAGRPAPRLRHPAGGAVAAPANLGGVHVHAGLPRLPLPGADVLDQGHRGGVDPHRVQGGPGVP